MSPGHPVGNKKFITLFYLPTELIAMMAGHLCDNDLYTLTRVSHRIACIAFLIYFVRKELILSSLTNTLSLCGEGFKALDVWHWSPAFSSLKRLACSFSFDPECAYTQMKHLQRCLNFLPRETRTFSRYVRLTHITAKSLDDLLSLLQSTAFLTGCTYITLSDITYEELPRRHCVSHASRRPRRLRGPKSAVATTILESLEHIRLIRLHLSPSQWQDFLSGLHILSLRSLEIWGSSSKVATFDFLRQHSDIHELQLIGCPSVEVTTPLNLARLLIPNPRYSEVVLLVPSPGRTCNYVR